MFVTMFEDMKQQVKDWTDEQEIEDYLARILLECPLDRRCRQCR